jgi:hypothetical protein
MITRALVYGLSLLVIIQVLIRVFNNNTFGTPWIPIGLAVALFVGIIAFTESRIKKAINRNRNF